MIEINSIMNNTVTIFTREREREKKKTTIGGYKAPNCSQWFDFFLNSPQLLAFHHHLWPRRGGFFGWKKILTIFWEVGESNMKSTWSKANHTQTNISPEKCWDCKSMFLSVWVMAPFQVMLSKFSGKSTTGGQKSPTRGRSWIVSWAKFERGLQNSGWKSGNKQVTLKFCKMSMKQWIYEK